MVVAVVVDNEVMVDVVVSVVPLAVPIEIVGVSDVEVSVDPIKPVVFVNIRLILPV